MATYLPHVDSYEVTVEETRSRKIYIQAATEELAVEKVKKLWEQGYTKCDENSNLELKIY